MVLVVDPSTPPADWEMAAEIPFGSGEDGLGLHADPEHESVPIGPASFTVVADGSIWIADVAKARLAHFGPDGTYLGQVTGLSEGLPEPRDLVQVGSDLYVVEDGGRIDSYLQRVRDGRLGDYVKLQIGRTSAYVLKLLPGLPNLYGEGIGGSSEWTDPLSIDPGLGAVTALPSEPMPDGSSFVLSVPHETEIDVTWISADQAVTQPVRIRLAGAALDDDFPGITVQEVVPLAGGVAIKIHVSTRQFHQFWVLRLSNRGEPLVWERIIDPTTDDETQRRRITAGPDGSLYIMVMDPDAERIYRRPPP